MDPILTPPVLETETTKPIKPTPATTPPATLLYKENAEELLKAPKAVRAVSFLKLQQQVTSNTSGDAVTLRAAERRRARVRRALFTV